MINLNLYHWELKIIIPITSNMYVDFRNLTHTHTETERDRESEKDRNRDRHLFVYM